MKLSRPRSQHWLIYGLAALIVLLSLYTIAGDWGVIHLWRLGGEQAKLDEQNYRLQKENDALRQRISRLRNDDSYLEKLAREELNLVRPGEVIYRFPSSELRKTRTRSLEKTPPESPRPSAQK
ncbi:MAG TPA: septum formation initiator family protein [Candidatus Acidoferrales bacterium]|nr:septum formation initiator family protein [Candidatus Acidoferrales bacterium]